MWTMNFQMFKMVLEKAEELEIKLSTSAGSSKKQESSRKHLSLLYWLCQSFFFFITKAVFISTVSSNNHDLCWYYKDTSILQWTVIVFFLKSGILLLNPYNQLLLTLQHGKVKWSLTSWQPPDISHQWKTRPFRWPLSILQYGILHLLMEDT